MGTILFYLLCGSLLSESFCQQYGHHNMPDASAGVYPRRNLPKAATFSQPDAVPITLPSRSTIQPPSTKVHPPRVQPTTLSQIPQIPQQPPVSDTVPLPPLQSTNRPWTSSNLPRQCTPYLCKNKGRCVDNESLGPRCKCRQLYIGDFCEVIVSPPKNIRMTQLTPEAIKISWQAPPRAKEIVGFVVQYNKFGEQEFAFSQIIHPSVTQFTLRDLEPGKQYTICISVVLYNVSLNKEAVLRDQCREIQTKPLSLSEKGISVPAMVAIIGCVILLLFIIMLVALCVQRKCLKQKAILMHELRREARAAGSVNMNTRSQPLRNANSATSDEYDTAKVRPPLASSFEEFRPIKPNTNPFLSPSPSPTHDCASNAHINEPYYGNLFHGNDSQVIMLTQRTCVSHGLSAQPDVTETNNPGSSQILQCGPNRRLQRIGGVPPANIRALPVTISNHVMRSANARDMDASGEFDLHRTYFFPKF